MGLHTPAPIGREWKPPTWLQCSHNASPPHSLPTLPCCRLHRRCLQVWQPVRLWHLRPPASTWHQSDQLQEHSHQQLLRLPRLSAMRPAALL